MSRIVNVDKLNKLAEALDERYQTLVENEQERASEAEGNLRNQIEATREMFDGKAFKYITQVEYNNLSEEEKNNPDITYFITDAVDLSHEHENKEFLDSLHAKKLVIGNCEKSLNENLNYSLDDIGAAEANHNHDDIYFTEYEMDIKIGEINDNIADCVKVEDFDGNIVDINFNSESSFITVEQFGAVGDGITDDTEAFQNAINFSSNERKTILLSDKTYIIGNLNIKRYTRILGSGWKSTCLKAKEGLTGDLLSIVESNANFIQIKDLYINGDKENNTCENLIFIDRIGSVGEADEGWKASDAWLVLDNLRIINGYGNGIYHKKARECRFNNISINNCDGYGMLCNGSDNNYSNITAWCNKLDGFRIYDSSSRFISCKAFANGDKDTLSNGFYIGSTIAISLICCEAQENYGHGYYLSNTKESVFQSVIANCNGLVNRYAEDGTVTNSFGFYFKGDVQNIILNGVCEDFRKMNGESQCQTHGIEFGSLMFSSIDLIVKNNENLYNTSDGDWIFNQGTNNIKINGTTYSLVETNGLRVNKSTDTGFTTVQMGSYSDDVRYELLGKQADGFQLDIYKGYTWVNSPFSVSSGGSIRLGASGKKVGFFGGNGITKQTSIADATDLESAIALINNLKSILIAYGLIN